MSLIIKRSCERCPATEEVPVTAEDIKSGKAPLGQADTKYEIKVGKNVACSYRYLCAACEAAVQKLVADIATKREKKTSLRARGD